MHFQSISDEVEFRGTATVEGGTVDLRGYPLLCYAPAQWGDGVRVASNGASVVAAGFAAKDAGAVAVLDDIAATHGVTLAEVCEAIRYGRDQGMI